MKLHVYAPAHAEQRRQQQCRRDANSDCDVDFDSDSDAFALKCGKKPGAPLRMQSKREGMRAHRKTTKPTLDASSDASRRRRRILSQVFSHGGWRGSKNV